MGVKTTCKILKDSNGAKKGAENKTGAEKGAKKGCNPIMGVPMTMTVAAEKVAEKGAKNIH